MYTNISNQMKISAGNYSQPYAVIAELDNSGSTSYYFITFYRKCIPDEKTLNLEFNKKQLECDNGVFVNSVGDSNSDFFAYKLNKRQYDSIKSAYEEYKNIPNGVRNNLSILTFMYTYCLCTFDIDMKDVLFYD